MNDYYKRTVLWTKRKISGIINATEHPMNLETPWNQKQPDGTYHAYAGDDIEAFLKRNCQTVPLPRNW